MAAQTFTGARAVIRIDNEIVAIAENYSFTVNTPMEPIHILGRFSSSEIVPLSYEAVPVNLSGVRIINEGPHKQGKVLKLQDLLNAEDVTITVGDRQGKSGQTPMATFIGCKSTGYSSGVSAKGSQRININYLGRYVQDESGDQAESANATDLPG
jgi:hypothetical protein